MSSGSGVRRYSSMWLELTSRLTPCYALGTAIVCGHVAAQHSSPIAIVALPISAHTCLIACMNTPKKPHQLNYWLELLHRVASLSLVAQALGTTMSYMRSDVWIGKILNTNLPLVYPPSALATLSLAMLSLLYSLGLERSSIMRLLMVKCVILLTVCLAFTAVLVPDVTNYKNNIPNHAAHDWSEVVRVGAMLVCSLISTGRVASHVDTIEGRSSVHAGAILLAIVSYTLICMSFSMLINIDLISTDDVAVVKIFAIRGDQGLFLVVYSLTVSILTLTFSELMSPAVHNVVGISSQNYMLPVVLAKEASFTSTHVYAIFFVGCLSAILCLICSMQVLICLVSGTYLLNHVVCVIASLWRRYQPSISISSNYCNGREAEYRPLRTEGDPAPGNSLSSPPGSRTELRGFPREEPGSPGEDQDQHQLISIHADSATDGDSRGSVTSLGSQTRFLRAGPASDFHPHDSNDSGHSSETDIDAAVAQYKEILLIESATNFSSARIPTSETWKKAVASITGIIVCTGILGASIHYSLFFVFFISLLASIFGGLLACQPQRPRVEGEILCPFWLSIANIISCGILLCQIIADIFWITSIWLLIGGGLLWKMRHIRRRTRRRRERIKLISPPLHRTVRTFVTRQRTTNANSESSSLHHQQLSV
nr:PREDICTED: uncharacterized protein LOC109039475 isoform X2 [Bemisia tabaci]